MNFRQRLQYILPNSKKNSFRGHNLHTSYNSPTRARTSPNLLTSSSSSGVFKPAPTSKGGGCTRWAKSLITRSKSDFIKVWIEVVEAMRIPSMERIITRSIPVTKKCIWFVCAKQIQIWNIKKEFKMKMLFHTQCIENRAVGRSLNPGGGGGNFNVVGSALALLVEIG